MDELSSFQIRIFIHNSGDPSVGIWPTTEVITLSWPDFYDEGERERVREIFKTAFQDMWGEHASVQFHDECPDCGRLKTVCSYNEKTDNCT